MSNKIELPYGIIVFASEDVAPDAPVQQAWANSKAEMLDAIESGIAQGYDPTKDQIVGYMPDKDKALDVQAVIKTRHGIHVRIFLLDESNIHHLVKYNIA